MLDLDEFYAFLNDLEVETKELGVVKLGRYLMGTQKYFLKEVAAGLNEGIHYFVVLKGRQVMITTICLALDLYWAFKNGGMQGTLATDTEENREMFRTNLTLFMESLPPAWRAPVRSHNRTQLVLGNRSRLIYQVAGKRKNAGFGRGKAITMMHATEVSSWGDQEGLASLEASLAESNPLRLYIFESTARGYNNSFYDMWETAKVATTQKAIFVGWWRNDFYRVKAGTDVYKVYWDGEFTSEETEWAAQVKELYDFVIDAEQIAWWRWALNEKMKEDLQLMYQEYPPTEDYAFVMTGSQFFSSQRLNDQHKIVAVKPYELRRFVFGAAFEDTTLIEAPEKTATLKIWHMPVERAVYVMGCDPAWGSSEWADRFCINVSRCWADQMEQVAEFCTAEMNTMQFAWAMLYLAGAYGDPALQSSMMMNLEVNGPGMAVWNEIQTLKMRAQLTREMSAISHILQNIQNYLYRRPDSTSPGGFAYHTKSSYDVKERMLGTMKDHHEYGSLIINSTDCLGEMKNVVREDGVLGAPGRGKDDRVIAQALSTLAWADPVVGVRLRLIQARLTKAVQAQQEKQTPVEKQAGRTIENYLKRIGLAEKKERVTR